MNEASGPTDTPEFPDVPAFVSVLNRHGVRYVVIGGYVAQGFISDYVTHDVDFTPSTDRENLDRLSAALTELGARIRTDAVSEGLPFAHDGASLMRAKMWNLQCAFGEFDITFEPAGGGYDHLAPRHHCSRCRHTVGRPCRRGRLQKAGQPGQGPARPAPARPSPGRT